MTRWPWAAMSIACAAMAAGCAPQKVLKVCADPNNLPFSNARGQGFENRLVGIIAKDLRARVEYTWWAQRRGFVRNTLKAETCDLWPGVATGVEMLQATRPYYRSTYVFVTRADRDLHIEGFDDPKLANLTIGVQMIGDDASNTPPAHALATRGMTRNVRGYMLYGDYSRPNPPAEIVRAVDRGDIDVAVVWGPLAGYFARTSRHPLRLDQAPAQDGAAWPMAFDISLGVRKDDKALRDELDRSLRRHAREIDKLLVDYGVPVVTG